MHLRPFQRRFVRAVESGRYDRCALSLPRGNGKSWLAGHLAVRALTPGDRLFAAGCESVLLAASLEQSRIVFRFIRAALEGDPAYRFQDSSTRVGVVHRPTNTRIRALGSNGKTAFGLGADTRFAIADEPGAWENAGGQLLADAIDTGLGKPDSRMMAIYIGTIAPASRGWWPALIEGGSAGRTYVQSLAGDPDAWDRWPTIRRCNPLTAISRQFRAKLIEERDAARRDGRLRARFASYRLNLPTADPACVLLTVEDWKRTVGRGVPPREGRPVVGVDLGGGRAWSAAVAVWRNGRTEARAIAPGLPSLAEQERRDQVPRGTYTRLAEAGTLTTDGARRVPRVGGRWWTRCARGGRWWWCATVSGWPSYRTPGRGCVWCPAWRAGRAHPRISGRCGVRRQTGRYRSRGSRARCWPRRWPWRRQNGRSGRRVTRQARHEQSGTGRRSGGAGAGRWGGVAAAGAAPGTDARGMSRQHRRLPWRALARARRAALDRDGWRCRRCGYPAGLEAHHVTPLQAGGAALALANLETLCRDCHLAEHADPDRRAWRRYLAGG